MAQLEAPSNRSPISETGVVLNNFRRRRYGFSWLWDGWREESRVLINRTAFVAGEVDLLAHLKRLPTESVSRMQRTIERRGRQFSVSCDADDRSDYFGLMLRGLSAQADRSESGMLTKGSRS